MSSPGSHHVASKTPGSLTPLQITNSTWSPDMSTKPAIEPNTGPVIVPRNDASVSRRGFFMKLGILFNGFAAMVLAVPVVGFLLSSVTRGRANGYSHGCRSGR